MKIRIIFIFILLWSCGPKPEPQPVMKPIIPEIDIDTRMVSPFEQGLMNSYDIYLYLKEAPSENDVLITFGKPDSTWVDEDGQVKIWYYYINEIQDYNSIELDPATGKVIGFEWD